MKENVSGCFFSEHSVYSLAALRAIEIEIEHGLTSAPTQYRLYGRRSCTALNNNSNNKTTICMAVLSRLDYCNAVLAGLSA